MYAAINRVVPTSFSLSGTGAGQQLLATTPWQDLFNGRPADVTRLQWNNNGAPAITDNVSFNFDWATAGSIGMVALFGFAPDGGASDQYKITFTGRRSSDTLGTYPYALGNNSATQLSFLRDDGSTVVVCMLPTANTAIQGLQMTIWNNRGGVTGLTANQLLSLGDVWISPGYTYEIDGNWKDTYPDDPVSESPNHQPWPIPYPPGRTFNGTRSNLPFAEAYQNATKPGWQQLRTQAASGQSSVIVPRFGTDPNAVTLNNINYSMLQTFARMGLMRISEIDRVAGGDYFTVDFTHAETPTLGA